MEQEIFPFERGPRICDVCGKLKHVPGIWGCACDPGHEDMVSLTDENGDRLLADGLCEEAATAYDQVYEVYRCHVCSREYPLSTQIGPMQVGPCGHTVIRARSEMADRLDIYLNLTEDEVCHLAADRTLVEEVCEYYAGLGWEDVGKIRFEGNDLTLWYHGEDDTWQVSTVSARSLLRFRRYLRGGARKALSGTARLESVEPE